MTKRDEWMKAHTAVYVAAFGRAPLFKTDSWDVLMFMEDIEALVSEEICDAKYANSESDSFLDEEGE